jgi:hypothetical protein
MHVQTTLATKTRARTRAIIIISRLVDPDDTCVRIHTTRAHTHTVLFTLPTTDDDSFLPVDLDTHDRLNWYVRTSWY